MVSARACARDPSISHAIIGLWRWNSVLSRMDLIFVNCSHTAILPMDPCPSAGSSTGPDLASRPRIHGVATTCPNEDI
eukprot:927939-Pelagomonas_calceolata.AAC.1